MRLPAPIGLLRRFKADPASRKRQRESAEKARILAAYNAHFDFAYYLETNRDVAAAGVDPLDHYVTYGSKEGRQPTKWFSPAFYRVRHIDQIPDGMEPFLHYIQHGRSGSLKTMSDDIFLCPETLVDSNGVVQANRPTNSSDFAYLVPFDYKPERRFKHRLCAIVHVFYVDLFPSILAYLQNIPDSIDLYISCDTPEKKAEIAEICGSWSKGTVEIRIEPNRGRDIAPTFVGFRDVFANYDVFFHAHTKRSPHGGEPLARWRDYLLENTVGSSEICASILSFFDDPKIGIVFPQHLFEIRGIINWGYDFEPAKALLARCGVELSQRLMLEFPSGSVYWARTEAVAPLLALNLSYEDFEPEAAQIDGTLAHAIERSMLFIVESRGFEWAKVIRAGLYPQPDTMLRVTAPEDILAHRLLVFRPISVDFRAMRTALTKSVPDVKPMLSFPSRQTRPRLNLLIPSVNRTHRFGGITTALRVFNDLLDELGDGFDRRIVVTDAAVDSSGVDDFSGYTLREIGRTFDVDRSLLINALDRESGQLDLRGSDIFIASAWWTAYILQDVIRHQRIMTGSRMPLIYLIQDDEPSFYGWSSRSVLAQSTYRPDDNLIPIVNSEELHDHMTAKYGLQRAVCLDYAIDPGVESNLSAQVRERKMLLYARPSVDRNTFAIIMEGIHLWQTADPVTAAAWEIVAMGEEFPKSLAWPARDVTIGGKASLADYGLELSSATVGISLMVSPHPSYPPLEMAHAGLITVTNAFANKNLGARSDNFINIASFRPADLAEAIAEATRRAEPLIGTIVPPRHLRSLPIHDEVRYSAARIADVVRTYLR